jgi:lipopolysaccharide/colanic/teichoic acid biosynthesis glycosyltransferase
MFKFRSMVKDAASIGPYFTSGNDPRITRVGRFLRRSSIDELPQLLNVLRGDMSLVGPRPDVPAQQALYRPDDWALRCSVRPASPAWRRPRCGPRPRRSSGCAADLDYVRGPGVWRDLRILCLTLGRLTGKGSN